jgi:hypothetical protein
MRLLVTLELDIKEPPQNRLNILVRVVDSIADGDIHNAARSMEPPEFIHRFKLKYKEIQVLTK